MDIGFNDWGECKCTCVRVKLKREDTYGGGSRELFPYKFLFRRRESAGIIKFHPFIGSRISVYPDKGSGYQFHIFCYYFCLRCRPLNGCDTIAGGDEIVEFYFRHVRIILIETFTSHLVSYLDKVAVILNIELIEIESECEVFNFIGTDRGCKSEHKSD